MRCAPLTLSTGAQDRIGITIENTSSIAFVGLLNAMAIYPAERNLYLHEARSSARYSPATFVLTYTIVELALEILGALGYSALVSLATFRLLPPPLADCRLITYDRR